jgi:N utilization substance protein B
VKARRAARQLALDILYEGEIRGILPLDALSLREEEGWVVTSDEESALIASRVDASPETVAYTKALVEGVQVHHADIDQLIATYADKWAIERMPVVDRNLVRIALFELFWGSDVPVAVAINEAVELAKSFSTEDSGRFVNGLLGRIVERELQRD